MNQGTERLRREKHVKETLLTKVVLTKTVSSFQLSKTMFVNNSRYQSIVTGPVTLMTLLIRSLLCQVPSPSSFSVCSLSSSSLWGRS